MTDSLDLTPEQLTGRWRSLGRRAVFRLTGSDRIRFLNGQVSNDVAKIREGERLAACLCNLKGKIEALVWIHLEQDAVILDGEVDQRESIAKRLDRYLISDDCEIEDLTDEVEVIHHFLDLSPGLKSHRLRFPGKDLILQDKTDSGFPEASEINDLEWDLFEILSILPKHGFEITGEEFPAELGLDDLAVDFHKGCYLGQEIISRIRSVGRIHRKIRRVLTELPQKRGATLHFAGGFSGKTTRDSSRLTEKFHISLAMVNTRPQNSSLPDNELLALIVDTIPPL